MILLTVRDLVYRYLRFLLVTLLVSVVLALLFVMTGIAHRFSVEPYDSVDAIGASYWLIPEGSSGPFTANRTLETALASQLGVDGAQPIVVGRATLIDGDHKDEVVLLGVQPGALGSPEVSSGEPLSGPGQVVVDAETGADVGDTVRIGGFPLKVVGRTTNRTVFAGTPLVFVDLTSVQQALYGNTDVASAILLNEKIEAPSGKTLLTADEVADDALNPVENAIKSITLAAVLLWIVAAIVIGAVVFLSALERQRDFAVLKAMGSRNRVLAGGLAIQAVLVALVASLVAMVLQRLLYPLFPLGVEVPSTAYWQIPLIAVAVALLAALVGVRKVLRLDPAQAFGGPGG